MNRQNIKVPFNLNEERRIIRPSSNLPYRHRNSYRGNKQRDSIRLLRKIVRFCLYAILAAFSIFILWLAIKFLVLAFLWVNSVIPSKFLIF